MQISQTLLLKRQLELQGRVHVELSAKSQLTTHPSRAVACALREQAQPDERLKSRRRLEITLALHEPLACIISRLAGAVRLSSNPIPTASENAAAIALAHHIKFTAAAGEQCLQQHRGRVLGFAGAVHAAGRLLDAAPVGALVHGVHVLQVLRQLVLPLRRNTATVSYVFR